MTTDPLSDFMARLGYVFNNQNFLTRGLRHASLNVLADNEPYEFLGDRVLSLVIADYLLAQYAQESAGDLARRSAYLVSTRLCADIARMWDLVKVLKFAPSAQKISEKMLADGCEAIIGAVFLDGGLCSARKVVLHHWQKFLNDMVEIPIDSKSQLQHWTGKRKLALPEYILLAQTGALHAPEFEVCVRVAGQNEVRAKASSCQRAEQKAAALLMAHLSAQDENVCDE